MTSSKPAAMRKEGKKAIRITPRLLWTRSLPESEKLIKSHEIISMITRKLTELPQAVKRVDDFPWQVPGKGKSCNQPRKPRPAFKHHPIHALGYS
jgi:hypothetical protein